MGTINLKSGLFVYISFFNLTYLLYFTSEIKYFKNFNSFIYIYLSNGIQSKYVTFLTSSQCIGGTCFCNISILMSLV
jgi:hypothetical protein